MKDVVEVLSDLIRFRTTSDNPSGIAKCADYIISYLRGSGLVIKKHVRNGKVSIVASFRETKTPQIMLNAHFDVVPASSNLFEPKIEGDKLYGRGSEDCKAQVAVLMNLMKHFSAQKRRPDIAIMLTSDEEVHGSDGVEYLLNVHGYRCEFAVVADGGDNWDIVTRHKSVLQVRLSAIGSSAHASRYWEGGENAIEKLLDAYLKVRRMFPKLHAPAWKPTANLSQIRGGDALNKVPDYAELYLDIRLTERESEAAILEKLGSVKSVQVEKVASADGLDTDPNNPYIKKLRKAAEAVLKRKVRTYHEHGATDARYFSAVGVPAVLFKPIGFGAHSETEHLVLSSIKPYFDILVLFVNSSARKLT